ncbi:Beta-hexosaminidase [hydrothermal vent metagenome]|uniref:beta-N-acetylhexosaminidase n=1 Tax=hydrothermal vent metagenome TaxID=652676 RepID=A0A3B0U206_9ZZZZ
MKTIKKSLFWCLMLTPVICGILFTCPLKVLAIEKPIIFPIPQQLKVTQDTFTVDESISVLVPENASEYDISLARLLVRELSGKYGVALKIKRCTSIPKDGRAVLMGTIDNPLVREYCNAHKLELTEQEPGPEGYILHVKNNLVVIAGWDAPGAFYGLQSLRQLLMGGNGKSIQGIEATDWPNLPFRGIRLYIPGPENIAFFKRFLADFMALYKFNKIIIEATCMRLDKHPEINAGWIEFAKYMKYTRSNRIKGILGNMRDSPNCDAGDGDIVEKDDVRDIIRFANKNHIEVIPEIPSLTHSYYLLTRHPELAELPGDIWPDTYCPSNPESYKLLFDVFDEYIEVFNPKMISIGHDEWWGAPLGVCPRCKGKDYSLLFAHDVNMIHDYLTKKGVKIVMWGDHLLENKRGVGPQNRVGITGYKYQIPGGLRYSVVEESIPKDILIINWFWADEDNDITLQQLGFKQIYGNLEPDIINWGSRVKRVGVIGGAASSWEGTTEFNFGKNRMYEFLGCANLLWSKNYLEEEALLKIAQGMMPGVRSSLRGEKAPSEENDAIVTIDISPHFNISTKKDIVGAKIGELRTGELESGREIFNLANPSSGSGKYAVVVGTEGEKENSLVNEVKGIQVDEDISSLIFLHACAVMASNKKSFRKIYNFEDTADLLGWYEIIYEDGFIESIPIRYGFNILEWDAERSGVIKEKLAKFKGKTWYTQNTLCYAADAINCAAETQSQPITFFAFEWVNKRFGKKVKKINLKGSNKYVSADGRITPNNAIMLIALSAVKKREKSQILNK